MIKELGPEQQQPFKDLLISHYAQSSPKIIGAVENKAGVPTFAVALRDGQFITIAEITKPTVPVTVDRFAEEWIQEKINNSLGEAVKLALKKRGKVNYQAFEMDNRDDNNKSIRRIRPFGTIEFTTILPHTQFNFEYYRDEVNTLMEIIPTIKTDFKKYIQKIQSLQNSLKDTLVEPDKKRELFEKLQECYANIDKQNASEKAEFEKNCAANYDELKAKAIAITESIKEATQFKEIREALGQLQTALRDKDLKRENRNEIFELVHSCYAELDKKRGEEQEEFEKTTAANFEIITKKMLAERDAIRITTDVQASREILKKLQSESWEMRIKREHRQMLQDGFNELFESVSQRYDELKFQLESESNVNKDELALKVEEVEKFVASSTDLKATKEQLKAMQKQLQDMRLTPNHRQELWNLIDKAFKEVNKKIDETFGEEKRVAEDNYNKLKPELLATIDEVKKTEMFKEAREKMKIAVDKVKDKNLKLLPRQRQELWKMMEDAYNELNERADKFFAGRKLEREQKDKDWAYRQDDRLFKMEKLMKHLQQEDLDDKGYISKMQDWLGTVRDNAATKEFRQTILDKIKVAEDKMTERKTRLADIKNDMKEVRQKLREFDERKKQDAEAAKKLKEEKAAVNATEIQTEENK
ncbi:MAG: hypothetical protein RIQ33_802 [Bacteroidota bacterium]